VPDSNIDVVLRKRRGEQAVGGTTVDGLIPVNEILLHRRPGYGEASVGRSAFRGRGQSSEGGASAVGAD